MNIYDFTVKTSQGKEKSLADYKDKVLLIVNTASKCGFTPQFDELQKLYLAYKDKGFEILGFPCNQFAAQDPGSFEGFDKEHPNAAVLEDVLKKNFPEYLEGDGIKWNFTKFLIDRDGTVVKRFEPTKVPSAIAADIEKLL